MFCQAGTAETAEGSALAVRERRWKVGTEPGLVFEAFSPNENSRRSSENLTASLKFKLCFGQDVWTFRPLQSSLLRWKYCLLLWRLKKNRKQARDGGFFLFKLLYLYSAPNCQNANTKEHWYWLFCDIHPVKVKHLYNVFQYLFFFFFYNVAASSNRKTDMMSSLLAHLTAHSEERSFLHCAPRREIRHRERTMATQTNPHLRKFQK